MTALSVRKRVECLDRTQRDLVGPQVSDSETFRVSKTLELGNHGRGCGTGPS